MANPGRFRIEIDKAKSGSVSDPHNGTMLKMFNLIDIGERAGSGNPNIFRVWRDQGWKEPLIEEFSEPDRTILSLSLLKKEDSDKRVKTTWQKLAILEYLTIMFLQSAQRFPIYLVLKMQEQEGYSAK